MNERIYIYDRSGNTVNDPELTVDYATGLRWSSLWPKGFGDASFMVKRDVARQWAVKQAYELVVRDGSRIVYQGRIGGLSKELRGMEEQINLTATGWYVVLVERSIRKRWADNAAISRFEAIGDSKMQRSFPVEKRENFLMVRMAAEDQRRETNERYVEQYDMPAGETVKRVTFNYAIDCGESVAIVVYGYNGTYVLEGGIVSGDASSSRDWTLTTPSQQIRLTFGPGEGEDYDQNDLGKVENFICYSETGTIDAKAVIEDVLQRIGNEISTDYSLIGNPGLEIIPFMTRDDNYESGDSIIQRVAKYGDASLRTWGFCVWSAFGTTDNLPRAEFTYRDVSDYDYRCRLDELSSFSDADSDEEIYNNIIVKYTAEKDRAMYRTASDNAGLTDADSIIRYGRRDYILDIGNGDVDRADYQGERFLEYHKSPLKKSSFSLYFQIRNKAGVYVPASWVRAGSRILIEDYNGGEIFFLRQVSYDAETGEISMQPDLPPDDMVVYLAQQEMGKE